MKRDEIIFNRFIKFFPDGCFHDLLLYWYSLMVKVQEQGYAFDFSSVANPYKSYLPKEKFDQYLSTGFQLVKEQAFEEYIEIVFSTFFAEVIREYPNQLCIAEILLLKKLLICLVQQDMETYTTFMVIFASLQANTKITTAHVNRNKK